MTQVLLVAGTRISFISFRMDLKSGFTKKTEAFEHKQDYPSLRSGWTSKGGFTKKTELFKQLFFLCL